MGFTMTVDNLETEAEIAKVLEHPLNMQDLMNINIYE
jgi:hypothetical protein